MQQINPAHLSLAQLVQLEDGEEVPADQPQTHPLTQSLTQPPTQSQAGTGQGEDRSEAEETPQRATPSAAGVPQPSAPGWMGGHGPRSTYTSTST